MQISATSRLVGVLRKLWSKQRAFRYRRARADVFGKIYQERLWSASESASGMGSSTRGTEMVRKLLPELFADLGITSLVDVPCGDFFWMRSVLQSSKLRYHGFDIVQELIARNTTQYGDDTTRFGVLDIVKSIPPAADLILCRHLLIHLPLNDAMTCIRNFKLSGSRWLLITSQPDCQRNEEIWWTGAYRPVNLELPPFNLSPVRRIPDSQDEQDRGELLLIPLDKVSL